MGCSALCLLLLAFGLPSLYFSDVSAAFAFRGSKLPSKGYKAVVIQSKDWAQQRAASPQTVSAVCTESEVIVTINPDLFGTRHPVQASDLTLGGCGVTSQVSTPPAFVIEGLLQGCGGILTMSADEMVYSFTLDYSPSPIPGIPIVRSNPAVVQIECHYPRYQNVSSNAFNPTWVPYTSTKSAEDILGFSLIIMNSDWSGPSSSKTFYLGDLISLQASVDNTNQAPLRLFVDHCVAASATDGSAPSYTFIGLHGCFIDGKTTNSNSHFVTPRVNSSILQFELDAFRFYGVATSSIFITCTLKVTLASQATDSLNKACSYVPGLSQWTSVDGSDQVCSCCDTNCVASIPGRKRAEKLKPRPRRSALTIPAEWEKTLVVGPLFLEGQRQPVVSEHLTAMEAQPSGSSVLILGLVLGVLALVCSAFLGFLYQKHLTSN
ncbi:zona pellucida sperm-binding protein 3-like isoform X3 [Erpetoichthys calabaricus]|uniref:zona pellucida sperm-binding protein 3-like isoform X2 n=1 Tax=Erpetoichthys calabaricus TaxID=27687 RepID=UPI002234028D|nr:zona pellucida sperm-binding protein 3-like isoform X2 [Erpetoichthys calabaricus]XP_051781268.1 zona pellucida sperm-binding protein 3-like isoform X3 [Erpetoichthys calabaricus]